MLGCAGLAIRAISSAKMRPSSRPKHGPSFATFCDLLGDKFNKDGHKQFNYKMGHEGLGVLVSTGYGDGVYPVYAEFKDGRVSKVTIEFI